MRIVHLAAGAGGMYCGACARDIGIARELIERGHDVEIVPLYTPLRFDGSEPLATAPILLGGINAYLEQSVPPWRYAPAVLRRALDHPKLLQFASRFAVSTKASDLGPMMVSVLRGARGRQRRSILEVVDYVERGARPDLVSITNSLLTGVAPELKRRLHVPIVCGLQGEDSFVESVPEPYRSQATSAMRENARSVDLFLSPSGSYADTMAAFLDVPRASIRIGRVGVDARPYRPSARTRPYPFTIGYLSVITPAKGIDILVDALIALLSRGREVELAVAGKALDERYWRQVVNRLDATPFAGAVRYVGELDFAAKVKFLRSCSALCVSSRIAETRGVVALEAQAAGVPVVVPDAGIFPEMLAITGGGVLYKHGDGADLAVAVERLMDDPEATLAMGDSGARMVAEQFSADRMAADALAAFEEAVRSAPAKDM